MSISSLRSVVALVAVAACTSALGLDGTHLDTDRDGVDDGADNCPTVFNPDQADRDGVGPGDACDVCPLDRVTKRDLDGDGIDDGCDLCIGPGPTGVDSDGDGIDDGCDPCIAGVSAFDVDDDHDGIADGCDTCVGYTGIDLDRDGIDDSCDECLGGPPDDQDGDGIEDGCDLCPVIPDPTNANSDTDQLGDACDYGPLGSSFESRVMFDGFFAADDTFWHPDPAWVVMADRLVVAPKPNPRTYASTLTLGGRFQVMARVEPTVDSNQIGIAFLDGGGMPVIQCLVDPRGVLVLVVNGVSIGGTPVLGEPTPAPPFILAMVGYADDLTLHCELRDPRSPNTATARAFLPFDDNLRQFALYVDGGGSFDWVEALRTL